MSKLSLAALFLIITCKLSVAKNLEFRNAWIVWNVGQGQWVTHVAADICLHFDVGGELGSYKSIQHQLKKNCSHKENFLYLSHWDFDHYFNIISLVKNFSSVCWAIRPELNKQGPTIQKILDLQLPFCPQTALAHFQVESWVPRKSSSSNDLSIVNKAGGFLFPGDSPQKQERLWSQELDIRSTRVLILGHHGSRTSTGNDLLDRLPEIKMTVASARMKKYGHPHKETLTRLGKNKIPVLKTEDWGSLWFF